MYLGPHHFQAQSRYFEDAIRFASLDEADEYVRANFAKVMN